jgi:iron-sulfur cluster repair protein YtfE (RIC family)
MQAISTRDSATVTTAATEPAPVRHDIFAAIHKALRLHMTDTLSRVGSADPFDDVQVDAALAQLRELLDFCEQHLDKENTYIHPALEQARAGSAAQTQADHVEHEEAIADLRDLAGLVADTCGAPRSAALTRLYRATARFVGHNFEHMAYEEAEHNAVLWAAYDDAQILQIEQRIVSGMPPAAMMALLRWFLPALNAPERAAMLGGMRSGMPAPAFAGVLELARGCLAPAEHAKLLAALGVSAAR